MASLLARGLAGMPEVRAGDDLAALIVRARGPDQLCDTHVVAIAHKAVSKAEGAVVALSTVTPSSRAQELAREHDKDPRVVQVVLEQSTHVLRAERGVLICRTRHGFVCANAGVDTSNAPSSDTVVLLPPDPDGSARRIRARLRELTGHAPAVLISDSFGRPWRHGQLDAAGLQLRATWLAVVDAAAACTELVRAKDSREPVVVIEGLERYLGDADGPGAAALLRAPAEDLFG
jgi:coenzyme F420-0:L-glutamate ligase/coenzyme F420-1:gamma-L-glutamate ligase